MTTIRGFGALLVVGSMMLPLGATQALEMQQRPEAGAIRPSLIARGRGGWGGAGRMGGGFRAQTGFQGAGTGLNRGNSQPTGGWSSRLGSNTARPTLNQPVINHDRPALQTGPFSQDGNRILNRDGSLTLNRDFSANVNRNWNRTVNINNVNLSPGWARAGWGAARPWSYGWYGGWATPTWSWWGARAAAWGVATLTSAAIINNAVNDAISNSSTSIVVPTTAYQLLYGTVAPTSASTISFAVTASGITYQLNADCNAGLLNGQPPSSAAEAELLNAACQVAFGSA